MKQIIVFVKAPVPGKVKTRLCPPLTRRQAAALYRGFARDSVALAREAAGPGRVVVAYAASKSFPDPSWLGEGPGLEHFEQEGGGLGARLAHAFQRAFAGGAQSAAVIGSDAPHLEPAELVRAFAELARKDVVLGPALDGGYWLAALAKPAPGLFEGIPWSSSEVLAATLKRAEALGLSAGLLAPCFDVDTPQDLSLLRRAVARLPPGRLVHTRRALEELASARAGR